MALAFTLTLGNTWGIFFPKGTVAELNRFCSCRRTPGGGEKALSPQSYKRMSQAVEFYQRGQPLQAAALIWMFWTPFTGRSCWGVRLSSITGESHTGCTLMDWQFFCLKSTDRGERQRKVAQADCQCPNWENDYQKLFAAQDQRDDHEQRVAHIPRTFISKHFLEEIWISGRMWQTMGRTFWSWWLTPARQVPTWSRIWLKARFLEIKLLSRIALSSYRLTATVHRTIPLRNWIISLGPAARGKTWWSKGSCDPPSGDDSSPGIKNRALCNWRSTWSILYLKW